MLLPSYPVHSPPPMLPIAVCENLLIFSYGNGAFLVRMLLYLKVQQLPLKNSTNLYLNFGLISPFPLNCNYSHGHSASLYFDL